MEDVHFLHHSPSSYFKNDILCIPLPDFNTSLKTSLMWYEVTCEDCLELFVEGWAYALRRYLKDSRREKALIVMLNIYYRFGFFNFIRIKNRKLYVSKLRHKIKFIHLDRFDGLNIDEILYHFNDVLMNLNFELKKNCRLPPIMIAVREYNDNNT